MTLRDIRERVAMIRGLMGKERPAQAELEMVKLYEAVLMEIGSNRELDKDRLAQLAREVLKVRDVI